MASDKFYADGAREWIAMIRRAVHFRAAQMAGGNGSKGKITGARKESCLGLRIQEYSEMAEVNEVWRIEGNDSRRGFLGTLSAGALLSMGIWPGCRSLPRQAQEASFEFMVVNDTHYMSEECGDWLTGAVGQMRRNSNADFCLLVGDLVEKGQTSHLGAVSDIFGGLRMPVHAQIGNHDYLTDDDRSGYESVFPGRINYSFEHQGWQFVGFDSTDGTRYENTLIQPATMDWLEREAAKLSRTQPTVIFTHFPLGAGVRYRPRNADAALDYFRGHNLRGVFNGHFHGYTERDWNSAPVVTNRCCALKRANHDGTKEKGYFVCRVKGGNVSREFVAAPS